MSAARYSRRVVADDWLRLASDPAWPICVQIVVEGTALPDRTALAAAVGVAAEACPGARLTRHGHRWVDTGRTPEVRELDGDAFDRETLTGLPALYRPLAGDRGGPTCEVVVLTGARPALVFRAHHAVMDAQGLLTFARAVFQALRGETPETAADDLDAVELLRRAGTGPRKTIPQNSQPPLRAAGPPEQRRPAFLRRTVDGRPSAVTAKIAHALARCAGGDLDVSVTVDLRRHVPEARTTASLSYALSLPVRADDTWRDVQQRMLESLAVRDELRETPPLPVIRMLGALPAPVTRALYRGIDARFGQGKAYAGFQVSHLGRLDLADFGGGGFTAETIYSLPTWGVCMIPMVTLVETGARTEIVLCGDDTHTALARRFLDTIGDALAPPEAVLRGRDTSPEVYLVPRFAEVVTTSPDRVALSESGREVTYAELLGLAGGVARQLTDRGIGRGDLVGVVAERSVAGAAALLGVLMAGAAYLPLDPGDPDERLRGILDDAGVRVLLAPRPHDQRPLGCATVVLDDVPPAAATPAAVTGEDLAYVIYTSGTSGEPKGVEVTHRNLAAYLGFALQEYEVDSATCFPLFTSLAFDLAVTTLLPLLAGGRVVLVPEAPNHVNLERVLTGSGVTALKITPSHLDLFHRLGISPSGIRLAVVGGEALTGSLAAIARELFGPDCRIVNEYGPTEATVGCVVHTYDPAADTGATVPIGRPAGTTSVHLLDDQGAHVAAGETGEIHLAGEQVARGYRGRPDRSFTQLADGTRVYRTGDLARRLPSGELECLGRADAQLKILGHRVEPAEIEHALARHPAVERAVVIARGQVLHAYLTASAEVSEKDLAAHAAEVLPPYAVPVSFVVLEEFPRTANGKVDLRALPGPSPVAAAVGDPVDEVLAAVLGIWARTLGLPAGTIAADSDFHRLGGTSIDLLAMIAAVDRELPGVALADHLAAIVAAPTPATVADLVPDPQR
ncbi:non-ribosomal peptide synthetase [Amycolatopsis sp. ATCC 39116]|uniref:non-ribosomal peptide synthetase n=1 Tax=Amycolatopsis sp. (strain ATCC 39116 / 75iv2) TaxID=385957 RepID=UPI0002627D90|nr:non-ribosomal peptide synthetase [Amycolatopsis sp. ATCC 39116]